MTSREWLTAVVLGLIVTALLLVYFPVAMVVSIASGVLAAARETALALAGHGLAS